MYPTVDVEVSQIWRLPIDSFQDSSSSWQPARQPSVQRKRYSATGIPRKQLLVFLPKILPLNFPHDFKNFQFSKSFTLIVLREGSLWILQPCADWTKPGGQAETFVWRSVRVFASWQGPGASHCEHHPLWNFTPVKKHRSRWRYFSLGRKTSSDPLRKNRIHDCFNFIEYSPSQWRIFCPASSNFWLSHRRGFLGSSEYQPLASVYF